MKHRFDDTIAAIATPPGEGGIGIVRLSGPDAIRIAAQLFRGPRGAAFCGTPGRVRYGHIVDAEGRVLDEVLVHCMRAPHSYTREDVVEIDGHGGQAPMTAILEAVLEAGARMARPGEFTLRAFRNGRIDLVQAEAVIDCIQARTRTGLQAAQAAAGGAVSRAIGAMRDTLADALAQIEAIVDFPEEDDTPGALAAPLIDGLRDARGRMHALLATADAGRLLREGAAVAIAGRPNVGKSSLFNALLRDARAIVSPQPGTTRDRLEDYIAIGGVPVKLIDMAGLRDTGDEVERIGVARAREAMAQAHLVLFVADAAAGLAPEDHALWRDAAAHGVPAAAVLNKIDLAPAAPAPALDPAPAAVCRVSALTGDGIDALEAALARLLTGGVPAGADAALLNRAHQKESLRRAAACIGRLLDNPHASPEFLALELQEALHALGEITGETTPDDILERIFDRFCIGK